MKIISKSTAMAMLAAAGTIAIFALFGPLAKWRATTEAETLKKEAAK